MEDTTWLENHTITSKIGSLMSLNKPWLKGIVQAALHRALWMLSLLRNRANFIGKLSSPRT
jgi:hypothetical protein